MEKYRDILITVKIREVGSHVGIDHFTSAAQKSF